MQGQATHDGEPGAVTLSRCFPMRYRQTTLGAVHRRGTATDHAADTRDADLLMILALRKLIVGYTDHIMHPDPLDSAGSRLRLAIYQYVIERDLNADVHLGHLAGAACVTCFQIIRDLSIVGGLTPGKFICNPASSSPHAFRAMHGITPGMLQRAWSN
jgi:hypothetical protein